MYTKLKKAELINICECLNLDKTGTKKDLMKRIQSDSIDPVIESTLNSTLNSPLNSPLNSSLDINNNIIIEEQNEEFEESLKLDRIKAIKRKIETNLLSDLSIFDVKLFLNSMNVDCSNVLEKSELFELLKEKYNTERSDQEELIDIQLNPDELRHARLKFYKNI